jgi:hypothetical protein
VESKLLFDIESSSEEVIIGDDLPLRILLQILVSSRIIVVNIASTSLVTSTVFIATSATSEAPATTIT